MVTHQFPDVARKKPDTNPKALADSLTAWFAKNGRDYPWRRTRNPYAILVSEIMLQQTQIATVLDRGYYSRWLDRFPDFQTLAAASETEILKAWEGLGYYRRARNLHKLAGVVVRDHGGRFPVEPEQIRALPGIGAYTAGAIASLAFDQPEPIVDGNVARVLARLFNDSTPIDSSDGKKKLWGRASTLVRASGHPRAFNSALMELGQTVCRPSSPLCGRCPVRGYCSATNPAALPVRRSRTPLTEITERVFFLHSDDGILLEQERGNRRTGLWKLPPLPHPEAARLPPVLHRSIYGITRYRVTLWVHEPPRAKQHWPASHRFIPESELSAVPLAAPYRKALNAVLRDRHFALKG